MLMQTRSFTVSAVSVDLTYVHNEALTKDIAARRERITRTSNKLLVEVEQIRALYSRRWVSGPPDRVKSSLAYLEECLKNWYRSGWDEYYSYALNALAEAKEHVEHERERERNRKQSKTV